MRRHKAKITPSRETQGAEAFQAGGRAASYHSQLVPLLAGGLGIAWHDAEDAVQNAALSTLEARQRPQNEPILDHNAWLRRVAVFEGLRVIRRKQVWCKHLESIGRSRVQVAIDPATEAERRECVKLVRRAIAALPARQREILLHTLRGATAADLAELLQVSVARVYQLVRKARKQMREYLEARL
jgi:RNA polymerase sigma factor (sigma-70 family)